MKNFIILISLLLFNNVYSSERINFEGNAVNITIPKGFCDITKSKFGTKYLNLINKIRSKTKQINLPSKSIKIIKICNDNKIIYPIGSIAIQNKTYKNKSLNQVNYNSGMSEILFIKSNRLKKLLKSSNENQNYTIKYIDMEEVFENENIFISKLTRIGESGIKEMEEFSYTGYTVLKDVIVLYNITNNIDYPNRVIEILKENAKKLKKLN